MEKIRLEETKMYGNDVFQKDAYYKSGDFFQKYCALSACDTYHVVTHTRCTSPEANSDKHRHNRTE